MKILLSAFACAPNVGSEAGVGWRYAMELSRRHQVIVLTDTSRQSLIKAFGILPPSLHVVYYRPRLTLNVQMNSRNAQMLYQLWQMGAWRVAKALDAKHDFDLVWHLTYGVFRQPSWMWRLGKPFVFGPVGGGESTPLRLRSGQRLPEQLRDLLRDILNQLAWVQPALWTCVRKADLVLAKTPETRACLPRSVRERTVVQQEVGGYLRHGTPLRASRAEGAPLRALFAGRLEGWKGSHFALAAFAQFVTAGGDGELVIVGSGPMEGRLCELIAQHGMGERIRMVSRMPQDELFALYESFDLLLFPSLHDSSGNVVLEALSFGLPVVCVDLGGPPELVTPECAVVVETQGIGPRELERRLAQALLDLYREPQRLQAMRLAGLAHVAQVTWEKQIGKIEAMIEALPAVQRRVGMDD